MKKVFLTVSTVFALSLMFSANYQGNDLVKNSAFADTGTCCPESGSSCTLNNSTYTNFYSKSSGSCKSGGKEVLTLAP